MPAANETAPIATAKVARRVARPPIPAAIRASTIASGISRSGRYAIPVRLTKIEAAARKPATVSAGRARSYEVELTRGPPDAASARTCGSDARAGPGGADDARRARPAAARRRLPRGPRPAHPVPA